MKGWESLNRCRTQDKPEGKHKTQKGTKNRIKTETYSIIFRIGCVNADLDQEFLAEFDTGGMIANTNN